MLKAINVTKSYQDKVALKNVSFEVKKGEVIGYTTDEFGTIIEKHKATNNGIILYMLATPPVNRGDTVICISRHVKR